MKPPAQSRIVVCGVVRDSETVIEREIQRILTALSIFKEVAIIVIESSSSDSTLSRLARVARNEKRLIFEHIKHNGPYAHLRSARIAEARNRALHILNEKFTNVDYVYVVDLDGVNRDLKAEAVLSCFNYSNWEMMSSNQPGGYYDILALRHTFWINYNYGEAYTELKKYFPEDLAKYISLDSKSLKIPISNPIIPVQSAFGGGAIYVFEAIRGKTYLGVDLFGNQICEHLSVNLAIGQEGGGLYINPSFVNIRHLGRLRTLPNKVLNKLKS